jgi:hypothetical protein
MIAFQSVNYVLFSFLTFRSFNEPPTEPTFFQVAFYKSISEKVFLHLIYIFKFSQFDIPVLQLSLNIHKSK